MGCSGERDGIAVVGMACVYPGAHSPDDLWRNVLAGRRFFRKAPPERLPLDWYYDPDPATPGKSYCDKLAVITGWRFDPIEFGIPPVVCRTSDMAHCLALWTARAAIADAGVDLDAIDRRRVGVIMGNSNGGEFSRSHYLRYRWPYVERAIRTAVSGTDREGRLEALLREVRRQFEEPLPEITEDSLPGNMANIVAGRICNHFDFGAGGYTLDGACASSLLAVAHACNALESGEMDIVLTGGVDVSLDPFEIVGFSKVQALTRDDIRPYDRRADGMLPGEGCGIVLLAREAHARQAGLPIRAVIRGWGYSSDGAGGITAPDVEGQMRALQRAYDRAGYRPSDVGLVEGHGTGTPLGDKVEVTALRHLMESTPGEATACIGSIKANIGHCKAAAGAAGIIKAILALERKILPPAVNCEHPNAAFGEPPRRLTPALQGREWSGGHGPRRAGVSAMGFGGCNSHVTLEEADPSGSPASEDLAILGSDQASELIVLSGSTLEELSERIRNLKTVAERLCQADLTDLSAALAAEPPRGDFRLAVVAETPWHLTEALELSGRRIERAHTLDDADDPEEGIYAGRTLSAPRLAALFPGQGSQRLGMGERLRHRYPFVRELYAEVEKEVEELFPAPLSVFVARDISAAGPDTREEWEGQLRATQIAQPAIVMASLAILRVLEELGLHPSVSLGHSLGEITALQAHGLCRPAAAVRMAALRGAAMAGLEAADPGAMVAVAAGPAEVEELLKPLAPRIGVSNYNSPRQTVVSGTSRAAGEFAELCRRANLRHQRLPVSHAFHSPIVAPALGAFRSALETVSLQPLREGVVSTCTGRPLPPDTDARDLLSKHLEQPVRFAQAVASARDAEPTLWVEIGPGGVLTRLVRDIFGTEGVRCLPTDLIGEDAHDLLNRVLAQAYVQGFPVKLERLFAHRYHRPFSLESFDPDFIVNPCERPVEQAVGSPVTLNRGLESLRPDGMSETRFAAYVERRGGFLRDLVAIDAVHENGGLEGQPGERKPSMPSERVADPQTSDDRGSDSATVPAEAASSGDPCAETSAMEFAAAWIAKRTGFPAGAIKPESKLRDDLNLDSIKVGELLITLSRRFGRDVMHDPGAAANATVAELLDHFDSKRDADPAKEQQSRREIRLNPVSSLGAWVRTFKMEEAPAPLNPPDGETGLPAEGTILVVGDPQR
ncbi:MAG: acyltransferase domain-containing protein, partial [Candidatus Eisenbacteria bacterium]|nr:acyltransferase domain-containing protein [Candidatus Eisenbacteria bacterium]